MRYLVLLIFLLGLYPATAQSVLKGKVIDAQTKKPLSFAQVYFNNTTLGTETADDGSFSINVNPLYTEVVVSYLGYTSVTFQVDPNALRKSYRVELEPSGVLINEIEIEAKRDENWFHNLSVFQANFIGTSKASDEVKIVNEKTLYFDRDKNGLLTAYAREPIVVENEHLGYKLIYDLVTFQLDTKSSRVYILGYPRFIEMKGSKRKKKRWKKRRRIAYYGSLPHFLKTVHEGNSQEEGYIVNQIEQIEDPTYPTDEQIEWARLQSRAYFHNGLSSSIPDTVRNIMSKSRKSKYIRKLYKEPINPSEYLAFPTLDFKNHWQVRYTKENPDPFYVAPGQLFATGKGDQVSVITLPMGKTTIREDYNAADPFSILTEEYWSFEKMAEMLTLDYRPESK